MKLKPFASSEELPNGITLPYLIAWLEAMIETEQHDLEATGTARGPRHDRLERFRDAVGVLDEIDQSSQL